MACLAGSNAIPGISRDPMNESNDIKKDDGEYAIEPPDPEIERHRNEMHERVQPMFVYPRSPQPAMPSEYRFSLRFLFGVTVVVAVTLGICQWVSPNVMAGVIGFVALAGLLVLTWAGPAFQKFQLAWGVLALLYVVYAIVAATNV